MSSRSTAPRSGFPYSSLMDFSSFLNPKGGIVPLHSGLAISSSVISVLEKQLLIYKCFFLDATYKPTCRRHNPADLPYWPGMTELEACFRGKEKPSFRSFYISIYISISGIKIFCFSGQNICFWYNFQTQLLDCDLGRPAARLLSRMIAFISSG